MVSEAKHGHGINIDVRECNMNLIELGGVYIMSECFAEVRDMKSEHGKIEERLSRHPRSEARIVSLSDTIENVGNDVEKADTAEQQVIREVRRIGHEALQGWAEGQEKKKSEELYKEIPGIRCHNKKNFIGTQSSEQ